MSFPSCLALAVALACGPPQDSVARSLPSAEYHVRVAAPAAASVDVELVLEGLPDGRGPLVLAMRNGSALARLPRPALTRKLSARDDAGEPLRVFVPRPFTWMVERPAQGGLHLGWSVPSELRTRPEVVEVDDSYEWPFLSEDSGLLYTACLFPLPVGFEFEARVHLELPPHWSAASSWPRDADGALLPPGRYALENDYVALGAWARRELDLVETPVTIVAPRGREEWLDLASELLEVLVPAELALFGARPAPGFLFVLEGPPTGAALPQLAGSAKASSLVISIPERLEGGALRDGLARLLAHEFYHTWGQSELDPPPSLRWIQEGFCDYYAYLVCMRTGLLAPSDFSGELARALQDWSEAGESTSLSLETAGEIDLFVSAPAARSLVYRGGMALAALWDRHIRSAQTDASLDDLMRALVHDPRWRKDGRAPRPEDVRSLLSKFVTPETAEQLFALSRVVGAPDLVELFRSVGAPVATEWHAEPLTFDARLEEATILETTVGSQVTRLGLRAGDELLTLNGHACITSRDVAMAWSNPRDGLMRASLRRGGELLELELPLPGRTLFLVDPRPWKEHLATPTLEHDDRD